MQTTEIERKNPRNQNIGAIALLNKSVLKPYGNQNPGASLSCQGSNTSTIVKYTDPINMGD